MATLDILSEIEARQELRALGAAVDATLLDAYISAISARIDAYVGPVVQRTVTAEIHDGDRYDIWLHKTPVASVTTVTEYTSAGVATSVSVDSLTTKNANGCWINTTGAHASRLTRMSSGTPTLWAAQVSVTYVAGRYATTATVGELFKQAARLTLQHVWKVQQGTGTVSFGDGGGFVFPVDLPRAVQSLLETERVPVGIA